MVQIMNEVASLVKAGDLSTSARTKLLVEALLVDFTSIRKQAIKYKAVLAKYLGNDTTQQSVFLTAIEDLYQAQSKADDAEAARLLKQVPVLLKDLYDNDIVDEDVILSWSKGSTAAGAPLRKAAVPFISWLETAEEESDDE
jgi:translation initiation factor 5